MTFWMIAISVLFFDQLSKFYIMHTLLPNMSIAIIPHVFHITYILNPGAAFGILVNQRWLFILIALVIFGGVLYFYRRIPESYRWFRCGLSLMVGGAAGNLVDRLWLGYVVDFFDFRIWPIFNIADIAIVCGVAMMIASVVFTKKEDEE